MNSINNTYSAMGCLSIILFSQVIDNIRNVRALFLLIEMLITVTVLLWGITLMSANKLLADDVSKENRFSFIFLASAFSMIQVIQVFNWISKRRLGLLIGFYQFTLSFGFFIKFGIVGQFNCYPLVTCIITQGA